MQKLVIFLTVLSMLLGACNTQPTTTPESTEVVASQVITEPTPVPTEAPTELPVEEVVEEPFQEEIEWSCENDPARNAIIDLGEFGQYRARCGDDGLYVRFSKYHRVAPFLELEFPKIKKGDTLTFNMPEEAETKIQMYGDSPVVIVNEIDKRSQLLNGIEDLQFLVNGEEWSYSSHLGTCSKYMGLLCLTDENGNDIIPKGAKIEVIALRGNASLSIVEALADEVEFVRNQPVEVSAPLRPVIEEWSYEKDPAYGMVIDVEGGKLEVRYGEEVYFSMPRNRLFLRPDNSLEKHVEETGYFSFTMPEGMSGWVEINVLLSGQFSETAYPGERRLVAAKVLVDGEEWIPEFHGYPSWVVPKSNDGNFLIPPGSKVEIYYIDTKNGSRYRTYYTRIWLERNYYQTETSWETGGGELPSFYRCTDEVQYGHADISEETVVDLGAHGAIRPLCSQEINRWFISFSESDGFVREGFQDKSPKVHIDIIGGALEFRMPTEGVVVYDSRRFSPTPNGFTEQSEIRRMPVIDWALLYINERLETCNYWDSFDNCPSTGVYVYFFN